MKSKVAMTRAEFEELVEQLKKVFSVVRLVDGEHLHQITFSEREGFQSEPCQCYAFWKKKERCENCISARVYKEKGQRTKLELIDSDIYQVISKYIEIDGVPYVMEMINLLDEDSLTDPSGQEKLIKRLSGYKKELYTDALTGAYNRRYYEDKIKHKKIDAGVAMFDLDDFKLYNDTYGHDAGDQVLQTVAATVQGCIRKTDYLIRYGGDEFLLVMPGIDRQIFPKKLQKIREAIVKTQVEGYTRLKISASIGGAITESRNVEETVFVADKYMYQAKNSKNMVVTEAEEEDKNHTSEKTFENGEKHRILIVDDSELNREILSEMLKDEFEIMQAADGESCLEMLEEYGTRISLILLDIVMPGMDGFEVLNYMNHENWIEDIPVIMISSEDADSTIRRAYEMGVSDYINRPFDAKVVHRRVLNTIKLYAKQRKLIALITAQVYEKEKNNRMLIEILSQIVEFRNGESGLHVLHINALTTMLLEKLVQKTDQYHLSWSDRLMISTASSLHDIGKIGIDEKILNKPGKLTPEERHEIEKHTLIGASILENLKMYEDEPLMKIAYQICRWHHERYDGKGYPDGLKGEEIPIAAQVVSLADVFDALISERVYKKAYSYDKAINMIQHGECGQFNPILLECLTEIRGRIEEELSEIAEESQGEKKTKTKSEELQQYDHAQERFFEKISQDIQNEYGTAGEALPEQIFGGGHRAKRKLRSEKE